MKKSIIILMVLISLVGCKKESSHEIKKQMDVLAVTPVSVIISKPVTYSYIFTYKAARGSLPLLLNRKVTGVGDMSNCAFADTAGKIVYLSFSINDASGVMSNVTTPNLVPFDPILPKNFDPSWKSCMWNAVKSCARNPLCQSGSCAREAIVGCVAGWSVMCIWGMLTPTVTPVLPKVIIGF